MYNVAVNTSAAKEHVAEIERCIRTIKERIRAFVTTLLFDYLPETIVVNSVYFEVIWINALPAKKYISDKFPPWELAKRKISTRQSIVCCCFAPIARCTTSQIRQTPWGHELTVLLRSEQLAIFRARRNFGSWRRPGRSWSAEVSMICPYQIGWIWRWTQQELRKNVNNRVHIWHSRK